MPRLPTIMPPVGKSGPGISRISSLSFCSREYGGAESDISVFSMIQITPSITSPRLCGGMFVAMPTAMPVEPLTSRFGYVAGKHRRLRRRLVEVRDVVDGVLVEVFHQAFGERLEPGFRVSIGGRRIAVDRAEVALAVDQGLAHVEVLRQADQRVVGRLIAVRMVVADDFADHLRALAVGAIRGQPHLAHRIKHAAMRGLQAVADVRQRSPDDHAHRVIQY